MLAAVNKPLTVPGKRVFLKTTTTTDTVSNASSNSSPLSSSTNNKNRLRCTCARTHTVMDVSSGADMFDAPRVHSNDATESTEGQTQENNENPVIKKDEAKKVSAPFRYNNCSHTLGICVTKLCAPLLRQVEPSQNAPPKAETEAPPAKRRGRPPKSATVAAAAADKDSTAPPAGGGRGRKRALADSGASADSTNSKMSKQQNDEGSKRQMDLQR